MTLPYSYFRLLLLIPVLLTASCASVSAPDKRDPLESFNRSVHNFNTVVDNAVARPVANAYQYVMPDFAETGVSNFFSNLGEVGTIVNDVLQGKFSQALQDLQRFVFNSTFGVLGLFDVASHMDLPKHNEDFGQTLATWGVGDGAYLVLPFLGPSTVRDASGLLIDLGYLDPVVYVSDDEARWSLIALRAIDRRAALLEATRIMENSGIDPYVFQRNAYFQIRENQIYDGNPPSRVELKAPTQQDLELENELEKELSQ